MRTIHGSAATSTSDAAAGAAIYSRRLLAVYDALVLGLSSRFVWRCPSERALTLYDEHVSANHLDVGVGTGFFLDRCRFPSPRPRLVLADLNPNSLAYASRRVRRYSPGLCRANVLEPLPLRPGAFDSIGLTYLLHCLPGTIRSKAVVFDNLRPLMKPGGLLFGTTILGQGVDHGVMARALMPLYNRRRIFSNLADTVQDLDDALAARFASRRVWVVGSVALFVATA